MEKLENQKNQFVNIVMSTVAWLAVILTLILVYLGNDILTNIAPIYPNFALPVFFIPWFLMIISSVQKLRHNNKKNALQIWILKTTIPLFLFTLPFFSNLLISSTIATRCSENCTVFFGFEPYCIYVAILFLFLLHFIPSKKLINKFKK